MDQPPDIGHVEGAEQLFLQMQELSIPENSQPLAVYTPEENAVIMIDALLRQIVVQKPVGRYAVTEQVHSQQVIVIFSQIGPQACNLTWGSGEEDRSPRCQKTPDLPEGIAHICMDIFASLEFCDLGRAFYVVEDQSLVFVSGSEDHTTLIQNQLGKLTDDTGRGSCLSKLRLVTPGRETFPLRVQLQGPQHRADILA